MEPIKTTDAGNGVTVAIYPDDSPESPREWSNLGTMICFHPDYNLGDENHGFTRETLIEKLREPRLVWLSLYLYDHSGISIRAGVPSLVKDNNFFPFDPGGWDTSLIGAIFVEREKVEDELTIPPGLSEAAYIEQILRGEVETYNQYLTGDVYGYVIEDAAGNNLDSCWGFYGIEDCEQEAMSAATYYVKRIHDREYGYCLTT
jgi:hypothetical protein